jgi:hypothetical protein
MHWNTINPRIFYIYIIIDEIHSKRVNLSSTAPGWLHWSQFNIGHPYYFDYGLRMRVLHCMPQNHVQWRVYSNSPSLPAAVLGNFRFNWVNFINKPLLHCVGLINWRFQWLSGLWISVHF